MKIIPFREATREEADLAASGNPYIVCILTTEPRGCWDDQDGKEGILINRELEPQEIGRLKQAKTREEVDDLLELVRNINEPTEYEVDLRAV